MAQQTAVEYLIDELRSGKNLQFEMTKCGHLITIHENILDKILQMEKEQICDALDFGKVCMLQSNYKSAEQYYKETYGQQQ